MGEKVGDKKPFDGNIPVFLVKGKNLPEAWERSVLELYHHGGEAKTEYDKEGDRLSKDSTMTVVVEDPLAEPMIHKAFPGGPEDLEEYRLEVMKGIKDHWCRALTNPDERALGRWEYTYHERLFHYAVPLSKTLEFCVDLPVVAKDLLQGKGIKALLDQPGVRVENRVVEKYDLKDGKSIVVGGDIEKTVVIDQIQMCVDALVKVPHTRRAQAIVWKPWEDSVAYDPACLQSIWTRILPGDDGTKRFSMNVRFRSRDAYKAGFMNMWALVHLQEDMAKRISEGRGEEIKVGRYCDQSDSYHIYGSMLDEFEGKFLDSLGKRTFEERTWNRAQMQPIFEEARLKIAEKVRKEDDNLREMGFL